MNALNDDLIDKVMLKISKDPDAWNQSEWICSTSACFAGHALIESGRYEIKVTQEGECPYDAIGCKCNTIASIVDKETKSPVSVDSRARELLGFTKEEARLVFLDTPTNLEEMAATIAGIREQRSETREG